MLFRLLCDCGASARAEVDERVCPLWLDPMAAVLRAITRQYGWRYSGGRLGKSVITCVCPKCRGTGLFLEADFVDPVLDID
jgi:hypothetical protein